MEKHATDNKIVPYIHRTASPAKIGEASGILTEMLLKNFSDPQSLEYFISQLGRKKLNLVFQQLRSVMDEDNVGKYKLLTSRFLHEVFQINFDFRNEKIEIGNDRKDLMFYPKNLLLGQIVDAARKFFPVEFRFDHFEKLSSEYCPEQSKISSYAGYYFVSNAEDFSNQNNQNIMMSVEEYLFYDLYNYWLIGEHLDHSENTWTLTRSKTQTQWSIVVQSQMCNVIFNVVSDADKKSCNIRTIVTF